MGFSMEHLDHLSKESRVLFLVGPGGNGGDALALARFLATDGFSSLSLLCMESKSELCLVQRKALTDFQVSWIGGEDAQSAIESAEVIVDGLFGVGLKGPIEGEGRAWVEMANRNTRALKIAIDIPSGMADEVSSSSTTFHADLTYAMGHAKACMFHPLFCASAGKRIEVLNPSFPPRFVASVPYVGTWESVAMKKEPVMRLDAFKNSRGSVAVFAGSREYTGAARLSCNAAFHAGSGLVTLFSDEDSYPVAVASAGLSVMVRHLEEGFDLSRFDAVLAGPGWGGAREELLLKILESKRPVVVDADGISALASLVKKGYRSESSMVLTPHVGELATLSSSLLGHDIVHDSPCVLNEGISELSYLLSATIVLKSAVNQIVEGKKMFFLDGKNPALGVAGSGDVLSGIILCLLGQGLTPFDAALNGCRIHQWKGKELARHGFFTSEELEESL